MDDRDNDSTDALRVYRLGLGERKEHEKWPETALW